MKQVVLLSAGLDSVVNLYLAREKGEVEGALTFNYGQRAAAREVENSRKICTHLGIRHKTVDIDWLKEWVHCALTSEEVPLPLHAQDEWWSGWVDLVESAEKVWVPNRNGIFIAIGAALAEAWGVKFLVVGFNAEEAETFPDNSVEFLEAVNAALEFSTRNQVQVRCYTLKWNKKRIFAEGMRRHIPWQYLWSCYDGGELMCGVCESCARLVKAARESDALGLLSGLFLREG